MDIEAQNYLTLTSNSSLCW